MGRIGLFQVSWPSSTGLSSSLASALQACALGLAIVIDFLTSLSLEALPWGYARSHHTLFFGDTIMGFLLHHLGAGSISEETRIYHFCIFRGTSLEATASVIGKTVDWDPPTFLWFTLPHGIHCPLPFPEFQICLDKFGDPSIEF